MGFDKRATVLPSGPGPYIAIITNHLDPIRMGRLEVSITDGLQNSITNQSETYVAQYLSPFYGATNAQFEGTDSTDFDQAQKSYGFWAVPPDIGNKVLIIFANGDPNQCFWIGCVPQTYKNNMIPGIAASTKTAMTPAQQQKYGQATFLPTAEFISKANSKIPNPDDRPKPVHPFADRLLAQGLLLDPVRGTATSSVRREAPSQVYGWSTPGPLDVKSKKYPIGYDGKSVAPVSRLGGHQIVMDDGVITEDGKGTTKIADEMLRIRTRTGHQILLHNSHDLIYVANAAGTAWIELTAQGKIDMYCQDSISIHSEGDFNFRADRDMNFEVLRNMNIRVSGNIIKVVEGDVSDTVSGSVYHNTTGEYHQEVQGSTYVTVGESMHTVATEGIHSEAGGMINQTSAQINMSSSGHMAISAEDHVSMSGGNAVTMQSEQINMNAIDATSATIATNTIAQIPGGLNVFRVPSISSTSTWQDGKFYNAGGFIDSIMQRVPMHEPWSQHENIDPTLFTKEKTDVSIGAIANQIDPNDPTLPATPRPLLGKDGQAVAQAPSANPPRTYRAGPGSDSGTLFDRPNPWSLDQPFLTKVVEVAEFLHFNPVDLLAIMYNESGASFDPAIITGGKRWSESYPNPLKACQGLIQFAGATLTTLLGANKTVDAHFAFIARQSRAQQMELVKKFFIYWKFPKNSLPNPVSIGNIYCSVFLPAFAGTPLGKPICSKGQGNNYYEHNSGFDKDKKGYITIDDLANTAGSHIPTVLGILKKAGVGVEKGKPGYFIVGGVQQSKTDGILRDSSGNPVKDGSGNPVRSGQ
jgi:hypothetical protein